MLPPSMIRNISNSSGGSGALRRSAGTINNSSNQQLETSVTCLSEQGNATGSHSNVNSNRNNRNDLLQQLRLITSQLSGSSTPSSLTSIAQTPTPRTQPPNNHQTNLRPEITQSNVGITASPTVVNNPSVGAVAKNPIDVDMTCSNSIGNTPSCSGSESQTELFPYILHGMLDDVERIGQSEVVSWNVDGKSFRIHDPDAFVSFILGKYLNRYVGGIASRLTQFRSDLKDWGFEDAVDGNRMGETFTHHCFQKGQANLCRYMRCGRKAVEPPRQQSSTSSNTALTRSVQGQAASMPSSTNVVPSANAMNLGNAAQLLFGQQIQQAKHHQQQQAFQQQQALQLQALLNGVTKGNNPVATMSLIQILMGQQQQKASHQVATAAIQRQHDNTVVNVPVINNASQTSSVRPISMNTVLAQTPATTSSGIQSTAAISTSMNKDVICHWPNKTSKEAQANPANSKASVSMKNNSSIVPSRPSLSAKRAAFLNKRSKATGAAYRKLNKKQKRSSTSTGSALVVKNRKKTMAIKSSSALSLNKNTTTTTNIDVFTLNEDFKEKAISDLLFPWKLHDMLDDTERSLDLKTHVVSWQIDGVSFNIHDKDRFVEEVIPKYFEKQPKDWDCFLNILSSWGFVRFTSGTQKGAFIHRLLVKGKRSICKQMRINGKTVSDWMKQHGQFLGRLHALLGYAENQGKRDIVSWTSDGKKFRIHDASAFMNSIFPLYFDSSTYSSFEQKLRRWGFMRTPANHQKVDKETRLENASYSHPHFVRGKLPNLVWVKSDMKITRTLQQHNFLVRLRVMLIDASRHGYQFVVSWAPHGKAFMIHDRPYFSNKIMPSYFKSKFTSFRQSLRNHGFAQIGGNGWDEGAYYHNLFLRDEPQLCQGLTQDQMKKAMPEWIPVEDEPNFYPADNVLESEVAAATSMVSLKSTLVTKPRSI